jgi:DnaD/phage-associated family protein
MKTFRGFSDSESFTQIPDAFFTVLLKDITDADELKVALYAVWGILHIEGAFGALREMNFEEEALGLSAADIRSGLEKAVRRGILLRSMHGTDVWYFLNSPRGRAAARTVNQGGWPESAGMSTAPQERPNVFKLYEENIGPLTPLLADSLKDAETTFTGEWIADAIKLAVENNKRSWKYCEAILKRWKEEGRGEKQNRRDHQASRQRDIEDKIKKFVGG